MKVTFNKEEIGKLVELLESSKKFKPSYNDLMNPNAPLKEGCKVLLEEDLPYEPESIDMTKIEPQLMLVKDEGVYFMTNAVKENAESEDQIRISYAIGYNPNDKTESSEEFYEKCREVSGSDFVDYYPVDLYHDTIKKNPNNKVITVDINDKFIEVY